MDSELQERDIESENFIFTEHVPSVGMAGIKLPKYFPVYIGHDIHWMQLRKPLVLRLHKFNKTKNPHEYYFSELQLYYPFTNESHLFPEDSEKCENLYKTKKDQILTIKGQVMKHLTAVEEGRERAEEILANEIGDQLDSNIAQENEDAATEGAMNILIYLYLIHQM